MSTPVSSASYRKIAPNVQPFNDFELVKPVYYYLDNRTCVWVLYSDMQPIINMQILLNAGKWHEPKQGLAPLLGKMIAEGTKQHNSQQIHEFFDSLGIFWDISTGVDQTQMNFYAMSKHFEKLLYMVAELLTEATFPPKELEQFKQKIIQQIQINKQKTNQEANLLSRECLYGNSHPYGYRLTEELVQTVQSEDLLCFYHQAICASPFHIILSGEISEKHLISLNKTIGSLSICSDTQPLVVHTKNSSHPTRIVVEKENALQTSIRVVCPLFVKKHPHQIPFGVLNEVLGGYFGSRLMKNLREKHGFTYGVHSTITFMRHEGFFSIGTDVNKEHRDAALEQIKFEIERLCQQLIPEEELTIVKNYMSGVYLKSVNTPIAIADLYKNISYHQLPDNYFDHYISHINSVTAEELLELSQKYLSGAFSEILVG
ncbi:MAG: insulinase family protein [Cytophagales bacterium]|nr:insulinase family protein [Cytophagales bacterium]MDW8383924.1 pitrilysin family protein [Flammeovirgaceae bacterium]